MDKVVIGQPFTQKFQEWLTYRDYVMPEGLSEPAVSIEETRLLVSFEFTTHGFSQVFTAGFGVRFAKVGQAIMELDDVMAGKLSLKVKEYSAKFPSIVIQND